MQVQAGKNKKIQSSKISKDKKNLNSQETNNGIDNNDRYQKKNGPSCQVIKKNYCSQRTAMNLPFVRKFTEENQLRELYVMEKIKRQRKGQNNQSQNHQKNGYNQQKIDKVQLERILAKGKQKKQWEKNGKKMIIYSKKNGKKFNEITEKNKIIQQRHPQLNNLRKDKMLQVCYNYQKSIEKNKILRRNKYGQSKIKQQIYQKRFIAGKYQIDQSQGHLYVRDSQDHECSAYILPSYCTYNNLYLKKQLKQNPNLDNNKGQESLLISYNQKDINKLLFNNYEEPRYPKEEKLQQYKGNEDEQQYLEKTIRKQTRLRQIQFLKYGEISGQQDDQQQEFKEYYEEDDGVLRMPTAKSQQCSFIYNGSGQNQEEEDQNNQSEQGRNYEQYEEQRQYQYEDYQQQKSQQIKQQREQQQIQFKEDDQQNYNIVQNDQKDHKKMSFHGQKMQKPQNYNYHFQKWEERPKWKSIEEISSFSMSVETQQKQPNHHRGHIDSQLIFPLSHHRLAQHEQKKIKEQYSSFFECLQELRDKKIEEKQGDESFLIKKQIGHQKVQKNEIKIQNSIKICAICLCEIQFNKYQQIQQITDPLPQEQKQQVSNLLNQDIYDAEQVQYHRDLPRILLVCGHTFHHQCIDNWFKKNGRCPNCRQTIYDIDYEGNSQDDAFYSSQSSLPISDQDNSMDIQDMLIRSEEEYEDGQEQEQKQEYEQEQEENNEEQEWHSQELQLSPRALTCLPYYNSFYLQSQKASSDNQ